MKQLTDQESELRVLSSMMNSEEACITALANLDDNDFNDPFRRAVFQLLDYIYTAGYKPTVAVALREGLKLGFIEGKSSHDKLREIYSHNPDHENIAYWVNNLKKTTKAKRARQIIAEAYEKLSKSDNADIDETIDGISRQFFDLAVEEQRGTQIDKGEDIAVLGQKLAQERVEKYRDNIELLKITGEFPLEGVHTGFLDLDRLTLGYRPGDLILVGAQTGHGKTAFALNTSTAICVENKEKLLYINTEMSREQVAFRLGGMLSGIPIHDIRIGRLSDEELKQVQNSYHNLVGTGLVMEHERRLNIHRMNMITRKHVIQNKVKLVILDYVGRMEKIDPKLSEWQELRNIAKEMKILAQTLNVACMVLFQLNANDTIQGSQQMKNEADLMLTLHPLPLDEDEANSARTKIQRHRKKTYEEFDYYIKVEKSRDSTSNVLIPVIFDKKVQRIRQAEEIKTGWEDLGREISKEKVINN